MFFTFDGIDGAGKSTQLQLFADWLKESGQQVRTCRDPGTTNLGEAVRAILLGADYRIDFRAEMLLYMACRAQMVAEFIQPAIDRGEVVISDRYILATVAYQGIAGDLNPDDIWTVGAVATNELLPNLTFVLDLPPEIAAERVGDKRDRLESRGLAYFTKVRDGFLAQAKLFPDTHVVVDASQSIADIQTQIREAYTEKFSTKKG